MKLTRTVLISIAAAVGLMGTAQAQQSNPVTSDPPAASVGRDAETNPGTPNRQNGAPNDRPATNAPPSTGVGSRGINGEPPNAGGVTPVPNIKSLDKQGRGGQEN